MAYGRRSFRRTGRYNSRPRRSYRSYASNVRTARAVARSEVRKSTAQNHPLQWVDILFNGGNVNTTPTMHSLVDAVFQAEWGYSEDWPKHAHSAAIGGVTRQATYVLSYATYQLRFQQDVENIESSNTFRTLFYSYIHTLAEDSVPLLDGVDIDSPPHTEFVKSMYFDRMRTLRAGSFDATAGVDEPEPTPGTALLKGNKRLGSKFKFYIQDDTNKGWEENDIRWEAQSDSIASGLQLYGFIRVYYRRLV